MTKNKLNNLSKGFTLVELIIVIVVIAILTTIVALSTINVQERSRDSQRNSSANIIAESLETYYSHNGEYPSCSQLTQGADTVTSTILKGVNSNVLESPNSSPANGNSIVCSDVTSSSSSSIYGYVGDGSTTCQTGNSCLEWTLKYREEATGNVVTIHSRHNAAIATSGKVTVTATTASSTQINTSWNAISNATSYQLQYSKNSDMSSATTSTYSTTSASIGGLSQGTTYYFQARAIAQDSQGNWSNTTSATTPVDSPTVATIAASLPNSTTARGTASGGACPSGTTLQNSIAYSYTTSATPSSSYSAYTVGAVRDVSASQGYQYAFKVQTKCSGPNASSTATSAASNNVVILINTPAAPTVGVASRPVPSTWSAGYNYYVTLVNSCPANTTVTNGTTAGKMNAREVGLSGQYYVNTTIAVPAAGFTDWWYLAWANGDTSEPFTYYFSYACSTAAAGTSHISNETTLPLTIVCEASRQNYTVDPRCDKWGQVQSNEPYAN